MSEDQKTGVGFYIAPILLARMRAQKNVSHESWEDQKEDVSGSVQRGFASDTVSMFSLPKEGYVSETIRFLLSVHVR